MEGTPFGRYRLLDVIGEGGMGLVYQAYDADTDRIVALKVLAERAATDPGYRERFRTESRITASLREPHVVPIHAFGEIDGHLYLDMRLIEGVDVKTLLLDGALSPQRAVAIVEQVASALDAAHANGLIHRDVKPSNVLVAAQEFVYLIDFGIARVTTEVGMTTTGATIGTLLYMAPERFSAGELDMRSDVYSLACVLYEMLTGEPPFAGESLEQQVAGHLTATPPRPSATSSSVPVAFDAVIARGMAKQPDDRYSSAGELARAAGVALSGPGRHRTATTVTVRQPKSRRRSRWRRWAAAAVVIAIVVAAGGYWLTRDRPTNDRPPIVLSTPTIEASGFSETDAQIWVGAIIEGAQPAQFVTVSFNLLDAASGIVASATGTKQAIYVDQRMIVDTTLVRPDGPPVVDIEATVQARTYDGATPPKYRDVALDVGEVALSAADGVTTVTATISNPSPQQLPSIDVSTVCFDAAGVIVGGGPAVYSGAVPGNGKTKAAAYIASATEPDRCEMLAQPGQY